MGKISVGFLLGLGAGLLLWWTFGRAPEQRVNSSTNHDSQSAVTATSGQSLHSQNVEVIHNIDKNDQIHPPVFVSNRTEKFTKSDIQPLSGMDKKVVCEPPSVPVPPIVSPSLTTTEPDPMVDPKISAPDDDEKIQIVRRKILKDLFEIYLSGGAFYHRLNGTDRHNNSKSMLLSELSFYGNVGAKLHVFDDESLYLRPQFEISDYRYSKDLSSAVISDQNIFAPGLYLGFGKRFSWITPEIFGAYEKEFYYFSPVLNRVEFDSDWMARLGVAIDTTLLEMHRWRAGANFDASYLTLGTVVDDGYEICGGPWIGFGPLNINFDFQFQHESTPTLDLNTLEVRSYARYLF